VKKLAHVKIVDVWLKLEASYLRDQMLLTKNPEFFSRFTVNLQIYPLLEI